MCSWRSNRDQKTDFIAELISSLSLNQWMTECRYWPWILKHFRWDCSILKVRLSAVLKISFQLLLNLNLCSLSDLITLILRRRCCISSLSWYIFFSGIEAAETPVCCPSLVIFISSCMDYVDARVMHCGLSFLIT